MARRTGAVWTVAMIVGLIVLAGYAITSLSSRRQRMVEVLAEQKRQEVARQVARFAEDFNAALGWESDIQYFSRNFRETYSIDVHRAAMRGDQRPLLVEAYVIDIDCADLGFTLVLGVLSDYLTPEIYIHARTTEAQVNAILDQEELAGSLSRTYALIIQPEDVNQVGFRTTI